jgi:hypothetical protein
MRASSAPILVVLRMPLAQSRNVTAAIAKLPMTLLVMMRVAERKNIFGTPVCKCGRCDG